MMDALAVWSLYRQLEGLEDALKQVQPVDLLRAAIANQDSFNDILKQVREGCADMPDYVRTFSHIEPSLILALAGDRSSFPKFLGKVLMLRQALRAWMELTLSPEEKQKLGFV
jgi:hypothetical protein